MALDQKTLQAYLQRWQAVAQVEQEEAQKATVAERWRRLNALLRMAGTLGLQPGEGEIQGEPAHQHWNRLRTLYLDERQDSSS